MGSVLSLTLLSCLCLTACDGSLEMRVVADWRIEIGSGTVGGITLSEPVTFDITPPQRIAIHDERHAAVALFNPDAGGWGKGVRLHAVQTAECSATDRFYPETLQVKSAAGEEAVQFVYGRDYEIDSQWGSFGRIKGSAIGENQEVFIDYDYEQDRLDTLAVNASGEVFLFAGIPSLGVVLPGAETAGFVPVARVWIPGRGKKLTKDNLYPISFEGWDGQSDSLCAAEESLPKTLEKLRTGIPLTLVTFGDSVSCGGGVGSDQSLWWQSQFMTRLKEQFPISQVTWKNAGWGGASSSAYMQSPAGSEHDYVRDVLAPKPDLVIIEFVNDAYL
ncbi:MAG: SGNH/GDSL hydrolase family protein, partial [Candidatus Hydrogenedentes bacterium]|nr:SGNH/GDSL hydrolase family protein [Candidatus Hydrogenedentota bacterium]